MNPLKDIQTIPLRDLTAESRYQRAKHQQQMLSQLCVQAAEEKWPGFTKLAAEVVAEEEAALMQLGPTA